VERVGGRSAIEKMTASQRMLPIALSATAAVAMPVAMRTTGCASPVRCSHLVTITATGRNITLQTR
jgi:hypothetical protein